MSSSQVIIISSSSKYFNIGNTFFIDFVFGPGTQCILTIGFFNDNSAKSFGKSFNLFGNSSSERFKNTMSVFTVLSNMDYITLTQFPILFVQEVIVTTTLFPLNILFNISNEIHIVMLFTIQHNKNGLSNDNPLRNKHEQQ